MTDLFGPFEAASPDCKPSVVQEELLKMGSMSGGRTGDTAYAYPHGEMSYIWNKF